MSDSTVDEVVVVRDALSWASHNWDAVNPDAQRARDLHAALDALDALAARLRDAEALLDRVIDAGVERWHTVVNDEPSLSAWLGLTDAEYAAWAEGCAAKLVSYFAAHPQEPT